MQAYIQFQFCEDPDTVLEDTARERELYETTLLRLLHEASSGPKNEMVVPNGRSMPHFGYKKSKSERVLGERLCCIGAATGKRKKMGFREALGQREGRICHLVQQQPQPIPAQLQHDHVRPHGADQLGGFLAALPRDMGDSEHISARAAPRRTLAGRLQHRHIAAYLRAQLWDGRCLICGWR